MTQLPENYPVDRPVYSRPPVVETLLGVQFKPLKSLRSVHYGLFWLDYLSEQRWRPASDEPLLGRYAESFDNAQLRPNQRRESEDEPIGIRVLFKNEDGSRSLQFQPDKLYFSWVRTEGDGGVRPHYSKLKEEFAQLYQTLGSFVEQNEMGKLAPDLWEVKYLNQIPSGSLWQEPEDWYRILPRYFQPDATPDESVRFATFEGEWYYEIKPKMGRVRVRVAKMLVNQKPPPVLYLRLLARGEVGESGVPDWSSGFDVGHGACNKIFNAITSQEAQKEWGISHES